MFLVGWAGLQPVSDSDCPFLQKVQDTLRGIDEKLAYRQFDRTTYGPQLDLVLTGECVDLVHGQLADLKSYLVTVLGEPVAVSVAGGDAVMNDS